MVKEYLDAIDKLKNIAKKCNDSEGVKIIKDGTNKISKIAKTFSKTETKKAANE